MLKNLPPGFMALDAKTIFKARNIFYVQQDDGATTVDVFVDGANHDIRVKSESSPTDIIKKANNACGEMLDIVKIYSNRTGKEGEGTTYYVNRSVVSDLTTQLHINGQETSTSIFIHSTISNNVPDVHLPMQKVIDILSTPSC